MLLIKLLFLCALGTIIVYLVIRSVRNAKFIAAILLPSKLSILIYTSVSQNNKAHIVIQECLNMHLLVMQMSKFQTWMESNLLIAGMCFRFLTNLFTKLTDCAVICSLT